MASTLGGSDPAHDLPDAEKDILERQLQEEARALMRRGKKRERNRKMARANEISRQKSKRAHQHG